TVHFFRKVSTGFAACALMAIGICAHAQAAAPAAQTSAPAAATQPAAEPAATTDIVGAWQGTLHVAAAADHPEINLRIVNKITKNDKGELKVLDYSIDQ